jgi:hypothetical protein
MKTNITKIVLSGIAAALLVPSMQASTIQLVTVGGNASIKLVQNRIPTILSGAVLTTNPTNSLLFKFVGTYGGNTIDWEWNLTGGAYAVSAIASSTPVTLEDGVSTAIPDFATSAVAPETTAIDSSPFQQDITVVVPVVFVKGSALGGVTNLTQRQASYLESSGDSLPATYFGGTNNDPVVYVGRNGLSAVRSLIDANVYFSGTALNYTTNSVPPYSAPQPYIGAGSGSEVAAIVGVLTNSVGTVAAQDIGSLPTLSYEGVPYSTANVLNGTYPLWGYERYIYLPTLSGTKLALVQALEAAVTNPTFQSTSSLFINKFVSYSALNALNGRSISGDGGPIFSNQ